VISRSSTIFAAILLICAGPSLAQLSLPVPSVGGLPALPDAGPLAGTLGSQVESLLDRPRREVAGLLRQARLDRLETLVRGNRQTIERDLDGAPARRGILLLIDADGAVLDKVAALGFVPGPPERIEGLDLNVSMLTLPPGMSLAQAQKLIRQKVPDANATSDQLYFQSGVSETPRGGAAGSGAATVDTPIGFIDGAPAHPVTAVKGFARGAPFASDHGSAVTALAYSVGARRILVADVYGNDPAGGNALAIAQGLGWLIGQGAKVISISLVGPRSPLLERAIAAAQTRGAVIVAAVGNDGPATPPAYPASYKGVLAITAVDKRNRPLIEAGRALHLDYAAPGADIRALDRTGRLVPVRGTSYAAPLVAVRAGAAFDRGIAQNRMVNALDSEARPISSRRPDPQTGRGLLCGTCR
jgi:hypothetical protein